MDKVSSSLCRRLRHIFVQKPAPAASVVRSTTASDNKFENLVDQFKKSSRLKGFRCQRLAYKTTVCRLAKAGQFSYIHDILDHQKQYPDIRNEHFTARLICLYGRAKMLDHALHLFDEMSDLNCPQTVISFNAILAACSLSESFDKAIELFRELPGKLSIEPDVISYTTAIRAFCDMGLLDKAILMLEEMEKNNVDPNAVMFDTLLSASYRSGRFFKGESLWNLMKEKKVRPDLRCYNSRVHGMVNEKRLSEALKLFKEMNEKGLKPNTYTYNSLIIAFVDKGNKEEAKRWYCTMLENDCAPDYVAFMTLIPFACDKNDIDFAFELCKKSLGLKKKLSYKIVQRVINELVKQLKMDEAHELVELNSSTRGLMHDNLSMTADEEKKGDGQDTELEETEGAETEAKSIGAASNSWTNALYFQPDKNSGDIRDENGEQNFMFGSVCFSDSLIERRRRNSKG